MSACGAADRKPGSPHARMTAAMLAAGADLQEAVRIANRAGGIHVGKLGTASVSYKELFEGEQ